MTTSYLPRTAPKGYGRRHAEVRQKLARIVDSGRAVCARCGFPIRPGEPWDLGHRDDDRTRYAGPEHRRCNRATAGRRNRHSRRW